MVYTLRKRPRWKAPSLGCSAVFYRTSPIRDDLHHVRMMSCALRRLNILSTTLRRVRCQRPAFLAPMATMAVQLVEEAAETSAAEVMRPMMTTTSTARVCARRVAIAILAILAARCRPPGSACTRATPLGMRAAQPRGVVCV